MRISVVTVSLNNVETIEDTIRSVQSQEYGSVEHVIIDGGSTDGTLAVIEKYSGQVGKVISEPDQGIYDAMNKGLRSSTGDIVGTLNADDIYENRLVLGEIARVFGDPAVEACYGDLVYIDPMDTDRVVRYWRSRDYVPGLFRKGWMPPHPTFFARNQVFLRCGYYDPEFPIAGDFELLLRLMEKDGIRTAYLPKTLVRMRLGGFSNRSLWNVLRQNAACYRALRKNNLRVSPWFVVSKIATRFRQRRDRPSDER